MTDGLDLKEQGIDTVAANSAAWQANALALFARFAAITPHEFTVEEFRVWAWDQGLREPHHCNAWGALMHTARRAHLIERITGKVRRALRKSAHARELPVYRSGVPR